MEEYFRGMSAPASTTIYNLERGALVKKYCLNSALID